MQYTIDFGAIIHGRNTRSYFSGDDRGVGGSSELTIVTEQKETDRCSADCQAIFSDGVTKRNTNILKCMRAGVRITIVVLEGVKTYRHQQTSFRTRYIVRNTTAGSKDQNDSIDNSYCKTKLALRSHPAYPDTGCGPRRRGQSNKHHENSGVSKRGYENLIARQLEGNRTDQHEQHNCNRCWEQIVREVLMQRHKQRRKSGHARTEAGLLRATIDEILKRITRQEQEDQQWSVDNGMVRVTPLGEHAAARCLHGAAWVKSGPQCGEIFMARMKGHIRRLRTLSLKDIDPILNDPSSISEPWSNHSAETKAHRIDLRRAYDGFIEAFGELRTAREDVLNV
jgi:hypothetical protein